MTKHTLFLSSVAAFVLSGGFALAEAHVDADGNPVVTAPAEGTMPEGSTDATVGGTAADALGGQIVVEQGDAEVDVNVEDPVVTVDQARPEVLVEQAQPQITVTVPEPTVNVEQQAPVITIEQAQPEVTVVIPEPTITVRMPEPDVNVETSDPEISVQQPEPIVRFVRPEPNITIEESEPRVNVTQADPEVNVTGGDQAEVTIEQTEPSIEIESEGDGTVDVTGADPVVDIEQAGEAEVDVEQGDANIVVEDAEGEAAEPMADEEANLVAPDAETTETDSAAMTTGGEMPAGRSDYRAVFADYTVNDVVGMEVFSESGVDVGDVDQLVVTSEGLAAVVGVGGFLGLGERDVALSLDRFTLTDNGMVLDALSEAELEAMPQWDGTGEVAGLEEKVIDLE